MESPGPLDLATQKKLVMIWKNIGPELEKVRIQDIQGANTIRSVRAFAGSLDETVRLHPPKAWSGLVEQQAIFSRARQ